MLAPPAKISCSRVVQIDSSGIIVLSWQSLTGPIVSAVYVPGIRVLASSTDG